MKRILTGLVFCLALALADQARAQASTQPQWLTNLPQAMAKARAERKLVLVDFTGSDWCKYCRALHDNVLSAEPFVGYAKTNLVLVEVDFPHKKAQSAELKKTNEMLKQRFGVDGFPTILVIDPAGRLLKNQSGYGKETAIEFVEELKKLKT